MQVEDRKLPGLVEALDAEGMRRRFAAVLGCSGEVQVQLLKHAPGKRCVVAYCIVRAEESRRIIGKLYRKDRGQIIFENLRQLWESAAGTSFSMAQPLAYLPELGMVLQSFVPGCRLVDLATSEDWPAAMSKVAENLAALHGLAIVSGEKRGMEDHLRKYCHPGPEMLITSCPESAALVETLLAGLRENKTLADAPLCAVHGDLNLAQIFIEEERAWFIDFDGFCLSHAALDLGNFLVTLQVHFAAQYEALSHALLESYLHSLRRNLYRDIHVTIQQASRHDCREALANSPATTIATRSPEMLTGLRTYQAFAYLRRAVICARTQATPDWRQQVQRLLEAGNAVL